MAKPNMYGMTKPYNPNLWRGMAKRKKTSPRPREQKRNLVADRLPAKKEEAKE